MTDGTAASTEIECRKVRLFTVSDWLRRWPSDVGLSARGFIVGIRSGTCARDVDFDTLSTIMKKKTIFNKESKFEKGIVRFFFRNSRTT